MHFFLIYAIIYITILRVTVIFVMTLSKIASLANVSVSTASKAFSMSPEVNEETREMIFDIAKKHGCFKKFFSAKYPKLVFAVICPEFESLHYTTAIAHIQRALEERGGEICVASTKFSKKRARELMDYYTKYARVDGVILFDAASALSASVDLPVVCVGRAADFAVRISNNSRPAIEKAVDHFISHGVTDIGFIGEHLTTSKERAFSEIMTDRLGSYNPDYIAIGDRFADGGYATAKRMIEGGKLPRAIICGYDYLAIGAMRAFTECGYRIPEDVAVIGMDDIPEAEFMNPPLSSINSNLKESCYVAADTIINMLMGKPYKKCTVIPAKLNLRQSSEI